MLLHVLARVLSPEARRRRWWRACTRSGREALVLGLLLCVWIELREVWLWLRLLRLLAGVSLLVSLSVRWRLRVPRVLWLLLWLLRVRAIDVRLELLAERAGRLERHPGGLLLHRGRGVRLAVWLLLLRLLWLREA